MSNEDQFECERCGAEMDYDLNWCSNSCHGEAIAEALADARTEEGI